MIKNICQSCRYYRPIKGLFSFQSSTGDCNKFRIPYTDYYMYADECRQDETKCGNAGKLFEKVPYLNMKIIKHNVVCAAPFLAPIACIYYLHFR